MQNIGNDNAGDAFYRYKMPKLMAKIEGRGNGIKTNIVNCVDIAGSLERNPEYVLKYFGCELGAQTNFDGKNGICIVNGAHESSKLSEVLEGFIKKYVQCYSCKNPETQVKIRKDFILLKCKACGFVSDVDMRHKLNTFILKNPPTSSLSKVEKKLKSQDEERIAIMEGDGVVKPEKKEKTEKKDKERTSDKKDKGEKKDKDKEKVEKAEKKEKKDKKKKDKKEGEGEGEAAEDDDDAADDDDGTVWMTDISEEAIKKRAEEQLSSVTAALVTQGNVEAEQEKERKRAEKEARKKAEEVAAIKAEEDARMEAEAAVELAAEFARKAVLEEENSPVGKVRKALKTKGDAIAEVKGLSVEGGLPGKMRVLYEAVLGNVEAEEKLSVAMLAHKPVFAAFAKDGAGQLAQLIALEHFLAVTKPERIKEVALVLKAMYDTDLAEDDVIVGWAGKENAGSILGVPVEAGVAIRKAASPVVEWLQQDDDEDSEDEE